MFPFSLRASLASRLALIWVALACSGCLRSTVSIQVDSAGQGHIQLTNLASTRAVRDLTKTMDLMVTLGMADADDRDALRLLFKNWGLNAAPGQPAFDRETLEQMAVLFGPDTKLADVREVETPDGYRGFTARYAFPHISRVRLGELATSIPGGEAAKDPAAWYEWSYGFGHRSEPVPVLQVQPPDRKTFDGAKPARPNDVETYLQAARGAPLLDGVLRKIVGGLQVRVQLQPSGSGIRTDAPHRSAAHPPLITLLEYKATSETTLEDIQHLLAARSPVDLEKLAERKLPGLTLSPPFQPVTVQFPAPSP